MEFIFVLLINTQIFGIDGELFFKIYGYSYYWQLHFDKIPGEIYYDQNFNVANPPDLEFEYCTSVILQADAIHDDNNHGTLDKNGNKFLIYLGKYKVTFNCGDLNLSQTIYLDYSDCDYPTNNNYETPDLFFRIINGDNRIIRTDNEFISDIGDFTNQTFKIWEQMKHPGYQTQNINCFYLNVTARNIVNNQTYGFITINDEPVYPSTPITLLKGTEPLFSTYSTLIEGNQLFRNWSTSSFNNPENILINNSTSLVEAIFYPTQPLTVTNNLLEGGCNVFYKVKWRGVNIEETKYSNNPPYYAFDFDNTQDKYDITAFTPISAFNTNWYFINWNDGTTNNIKSEVGIGSPLSLTANYKGNLTSNQSDGFSSNGQRKIVRDNSGYYHCVYSSLGKVWYTKSTTTNFTGTWTQDVELFSGVICKNPSIDYYINNIVVVAEIQDGTFSYIALYRSDGSPVEWIDYIDPVVWGNSYPVVSYTNNEILIIYKDSLSSKLKYKRDRIIDPDGWDVVLPTILPGSSIYSKNPTITNEKLNQRLYIAWQEGTSSIKYLYAPPLSYNNRYFDPVETVTTNSGYSTHSNPSISLISNTQPIISWTGGRKESVLNKVNGTETLVWVNRALIRVKGGSWGDFTAVSSDVNFTNNNSSLNSTGETVIAFSQSGGQSAKWLKRVGGYYSEINPLSHNGLQVNVSNGSGIANQKALVFNTTNLPYPINRSTTAFNNLAKIVSDTIITYGRTGIVSKQGVEFVFCAEDILLEDENIKFTERVDTLPVLNLNELNTAARTNNFYLTSNSDFYFSLYYLVINPDLAAEVLNDEDYFNFKLELVNAATNQVAGTFDNITYTKQNVYDYENINYKVDCSGISAGNYYLRIVADANNYTGLAISNSQNDNGNLLKRNYKEVNYSGTSLPKEYALSQNYPNPFNPTTTIKYDLPNDGIVQLEVYDILGRRITTLVNDYKSAGSYEHQFDASQLASGVYIYKLQAGDFVSSKKMILLK